MGSAVNVCQVQYLPRSALCRMLQCYENGAGGPTTGHHHSTGAPERPTGFWVARCGRGAAQNAVRFSSIPQHLFVGFCRHCCASSRGRCLQTTQLRPLVRLPHWLRLRKARTSGCSSGLFSPRLAARALACAAGSGTGRRQPRMVSSLRCTSSKSSAGGQRRLTQGKQGPANVSHLLPGPPALPSLPARAAARPARGRLLASSLARRVMRWGCWSDWH